LKQDATQIEPEIVAKNLELIYLFVTTPICRDPSIINKIIDMLMVGMEKGT